MLSIFATALPFMLLLYVLLLVIATNLLIFPIFELPGGTAIILVSFIAVSVLLLLCSLLLIFLTNLCFSLFRSSNAIVAMLLSLVSANLQGGEPDETFAVKEVILDFARSKSDKKGWGIMRVEHVSKGKHICIHRIAFYFISSLHY